MYNTTIPIFIHGFKSLAAILTKAEAHCTAKKIKPEALLNFRLFPDMLPLTSQVQLASDHAKTMAARLSGTANPSFPDEEKTFPELQQRIAKTIAFLESIDPKLLADAADRSVKGRVSSATEKEMPGAEYFSRYAVPNFYFHLTTAYNILRHNGVELGKGDYMGRNI
jgi:hypothetical protein